MTYHFRIVTVISLLLCQPLVATEATSVATTLKGTIVNNSGKQMYCALVTLKGNVMVKKETVRVNNSAATEINVEDGRQQSFILTRPQEEYTSNKWTTKCVIYDEQTKAFIEYVLEENNPLPSSALAATAALPEANCSGAVQITVLPSSNKNTPFKVIVKRKQVSCQKFVNTRRKLKEAGSTLKKKFEQVFRRETSTPEALSQKAPAVPVQKVESGGYRLAPGETLPSPYEAGKY